MNLKQIEVFKAIMETGSTIAAAAALGLSQSAMSRHLSALETDIGFALFVRDKGRLVPRPEARALIGDVESLSDEVLRVRRKIAEIRKGSTADMLIKVAVPHSLASTMMPGLVADFLRDWPDLSVEVLSGPYGDIERMIQGKVADLGFVRLPSEHSGLDARPLVQSPTSCVMPRGHPLAARDHIELEHLCGQDLILLGRQRLNRAELEYKLRHSGPSYRCRLEVHSVETACASAAAGLGIAIVPTLICSFFRAMPIEIRPFQPGSCSDYGIITLPGLALSSPAESLVRMLRDQVARISPAIVPV